MRIDIGQYRVRHQETYRLPAGQQLTDLAARVPLYQQAQKLIMDDAAAIPLWGKRVIIGAKTNIQNVLWSQNVYPLFYNTTVTK